MPSTPESRNRGIQDALVSFRAVILLLALLGNCAAQLQVGSRTTMNLNGNAGFGFSGFNAYPELSGNSWMFNGNATLTGAYYDPKFLSFRIGPYYNQSRANSNSESLTQSTGVSASTSLFSGGNFPGSITDMRTYHTSGMFGLPGGLDYTTDGNAQAFTINWNVHLPRKPSLSFTFQDGGSDYSVIGANTDGTSHYRSFSIQSQYTVLGFNLNGGFSHGSGSATVPLLFTDNAQRETGSDSNSFSFGIGHRLPLHGTWSAVANRTETSFDVSEAGSHSAVDNVSSGVSFSPFRRFNFGFSSRYTDNLTGYLYQGLISSGAVVPGSAFTHTATSLDYSGYANYSIPLWNLTFSGRADHREQTTGKGNASSDSQSGSIGAARQVLGGTLTGSVGMSHSSSSTSPLTMLGVTASSMYSRMLHAWQVTATGYYSQNTQTFLVGQTVTSLSYSGSVARAFGNSLRWHLTGSGSTTALNSTDNSPNFAQSYSTSIETKWLGASAGYGRSSGQSILTASGVVTPTSPEVIVLAPELILYNGHSYTFSATSGFRNLLVMASYSSVFSGTAEPDARSTNTSHTFTANLTYKLRKLDFTAGYTKLDQRFTATSATNTNVRSFYFGVSRWFNFF